MWNRARRSVRVNIWVLTPVLPLFSAVPFPRPVSSQLFRFERPRYPIIVLSINIKLLNSMILNNCERTMNRYTVRDVYK